MDLRNLGTRGLEVSALGLGCMGMSDFYGTAEERDESEAIATIDRAAELGVTLLDTADMYGPFTNEQLVGRALTGRRDQYVVATKFGIERKTDGSQAANGRPEYVHQACDASLQRLDIDVIDLYYQHRLDRAVPIEETVGAMDELVDAGKVRFLGLCEVGPETIRRAHAVHPLSAVQSEYSLFSRDVEEAVLPTLRELGVGFVSYSPLGRGILTGAVTAGTLDPTDIRRARFPRFADDNLNANLAIAARSATSPRKRASPPRNSRSPGCSTAAPTSSRSPAPNGASVSRRTQGRPRSRSTRLTSHALKRLCGRRTCRDSGTGTCRRSIADRALWSARHEYQRRALRMDAHPRAGGVVAAAALHRRARGR